MEKMDFNKQDGLLTCVIQDYQTQKVLMVGYMNEEALQKTLKEKKVTFFSRTKKRLWTKGETSGNFLRLVSLTPDCDRDTLLIQVNPTGPVCHTGTDTCFNEKNEIWDLKQLEKVIHDRLENPNDQSYTFKLMNQGMNKVAQKVGEEAVELIIEAKDDHPDLFLGEAADLMYHFLVLLAAKKTTLSDVEQVLKNRHQKKLKPQ